MDQLSDKARKIQEVANELGWNSDLESLIRRVQEIDDGLVQEDEFLYILDWSQICNLFHKLDQSVAPAGSKKKYTVPDLLVEFNQKGKSETYLVEVKTSKSSKLSWTETYYNGLKNYSKLLGIPILIAWKWRTFDIWTLFEIEHFSKGPSNYKMSLEKAHKENLMSRLAGDYVIIPYEGFGIHFKFKKREIVERRDNEVTWETICDEIYLTGKNGLKVEKVDKGIFALLMSLTTEESAAEDENSIIQSFYPLPNNLSFAQSVPIRLSKAFSKDQVNWIEKIKSQKYPIKYSKLRKSLEQGIENEVIRNILILQPYSENINYHNTT